MIYLLLYHPPNFIYVYYILAFNFFFLAGLKRNVLPTPKGWRRPVSIDAKCQILQKSNLIKAQQAHQNGLPLARACHFFKYSGNKKTEDFCLKTPRRQ